MKKNIFEKIFEILDISVVILLFFISLFGFYCFFAFVLVLLEHGGYLTTHF